MLFRIRPNAGVIMKRIVILAILLSPTLAVAQSYRPLETVDEARQS